MSERGVETAQARTGVAAWSAPADAACRGAGFTTCTARVLDVVGAGIVVCSEAGEVLYLNSAGGRVLGLGPEQATGTNVAGVLAPLPTLRELWEQAPDGESAEITVATASGRSLNIGFQLGDTAGVRGNPCEGQTVILFRDISDFLRLRQERDRFLRVATVSRLLPTIAHELKNPLAGIQSLVEVLAEEVSEPRHGEDLKVILGELERLRAIIDGLGLADGDLLGNSEVVDLEAEVDAAFRLVGSSAGHCSVDLRYDGVPGLAAEVNRATFRLVLLNLLGNALDACSPGASITVDARQLPGQLEVEVTDTGRGMEGEVLERATELFFSTKQRGSGIGLALVWEIVRRSGGALTIDSAVQSGTTIRMRVPQGVQR